MSDLEVLKAHREAVRKEYERVGKPLLDEIVITSQHITNLQREQGLRFWVEYWHFGTLEKDDAEDLEEALETARAIENSDSGVVARVYGPGVEITDSEQWD